VLLWTHLLATGLFLGSTAGIALFTVPRAARLSGAVERRAYLVRTFRVYDPLAIALLGIMVMTGAWSVTGFKQSLGADYGTFAAHLAWKLALAFLVVMSGTWVTFGIGHRLVRQEEWDEPIDEARMNGVLGRLRGAAWTTVLLTIATIAVAAGR
jgi:uncharacterized membrane protein